MKRSLLNYLRCPCCGSTLDLQVIRGDETYAVEAGVLVCASECAWYPIINFVPVLLDFPVPLQKEFKARHPGAKGTELPFPNGTPRKGELDIQRSFTVEWAGLGQDQFTFAFSMTQREKHLRAELDWPEGLLNRAANQPPMLVLDIGAGFGLEPVYIHNAIGGEIIEIDINLSLLQSEQRLLECPASTQSLPVSLQHHSLSARSTWSIRMVLFTTLIRPKRRSAPLNVSENQAASSTLGFMRPRTSSNFRGKDRCSMYLKPCCSQRFPNCQQLCKMCSSTHSLIATCWSVVGTWAVVRSGHSRTRFTRHGTSGRRARPPSSLQ